jgi:hypothetical protein
VYRRNCASRQRLWAIKRYNIGAGTARVLGALVSPSIVTRVALLVSNIRKRMSDPTVVAGADGDNEAHTSKESDPPDSNSTSSRNRKIVANLSPVVRIVLFNQNLWAQLNDGHAFCSLVELR